MGRRRDTPPLPEDTSALCDAYLAFIEERRQCDQTQKRGIRRVALAFGRYLRRSRVRLSAIRIEHVDAFLAAFTASYARGTQRLYRSYLRRFLRYLHHERHLLPRDLAALVVGPPMFAKAKPPKFLRPHEVRRLFDHLSYGTGRELRTYAMVHLAFYLGLRPSEIARLTLDDICFAKALLTVDHRKNDQPIELPIPESVIKAITAYIVGGRPQVAWRTLFVQCRRPYRPMPPNLVGRYLTDALHSAGIQATAYWLRHTYAQNLLEAGATIFEIKQMLGHDSIETTGKYLSIHTALMRKVMFDERL